MVASGIRVGKKYPDVGHGVFSIPNLRYCKELEDVIAVAKSKLYLLPTEYQLRMLNVYINELKLNNIWALRDLVYVFGYNSLQSRILQATAPSSDEPHFKGSLHDFSCINLKNSNQYELVRTATPIPVVPFYSSLGLKGISGAGDGGYDTGWNPATAGNLWSQNSASMSCYLANFDDVTAGANSVCGIRNAGTSNILNFRALDGTNTVGGVNRDDANTTFTTGISSAYGHHHLDRSASNLTTYYKNGFSVSTSASASVSIAANTSTMYVLSRNVAGFTNCFTRNPLSFISFGASLGGTLQKIDYELFTQFRTKLGYQ